MHLLQIWLARARLRGGQACRVHHHDFAAWLLWLGLALGGLFALVGVPGSALALYIEIDKALHPASELPGTDQGLAWSSPV